MRAYQRWLAALAGAALLGPLPSAGMAASELIAATAKARPAWVDSTPVEAGLLSFVGSGQMASEASAIDAARQDAWDQAAQAAGAEVSSSYRETQSLTGGSVTATTRVASLAAIQGLQVTQRYVEEWGEKGQPSTLKVWVLAQLPRQAFQAAVADAGRKLADLAAGQRGRHAALEQGLGEAEALTLKGRQQAASGFADRARESFRRAQAELELTVAGAGMDEPDLRERGQGLLLTVRGELGQQGLGLADLQAAVGRLARAMTQQHLPAAVVRATYQGSAFGGPMGPRLVKLVEDELVRRAPGAVVPSATFLTRLARMKIPLEDLAGGMTPQALDGLGVHSVIYLDYYGRSDGVELTMSLQNPGNGLLLTATQALLPQALVGQLEPGPPHLEAAERTLAAFADAQAQPQGLDVKLWPDHGESSTYQEGQKIVLHARVAQDCYLYLVHADSDGALQLLQPNPWHPLARAAAGQVLDLPKAADAFDFVAIQPYGAELIVAIASTVPLPSLEATATEGFTDLKQGGAGVVADYLALPTDKRGMSRTVYTTVAGQ
jgi:hypothetical protein